MEYLVTWTISLDADSHLGAAQEAKAIQLDSDSIADVFTVQRIGADGRRFDPKHIDLRPPRHQRIGMARSFAERKARRKDR